jgi:GWxTD domain-containing protein
MKRNHLLLILLSIGLFGGCAIIGPATSLPDNVEVYARSLPYNNGQLGIERKNGDKFLLVYTHPVVERWMNNPNSISWRVAFYAPSGADIVWTQDSDIADDSYFQRGSLYVPLDRQTDGGILFFTIVDQRGSKLVHKFIRINDSENIGKSWLSENDSACYSSTADVKFYKQSYGLPLPITDYVTTPLNMVKADSLIHYSSIGRKKCYGFTETGFVKVEEDGIMETRPIVMAGYPEVRTAGLLSSSLRYLSYDSTMVNLPWDQQKFKVDSFWLSLTTGQEQARKLLQSYYSRVKFANIHFTDWRPGYLSDRGEVYILLGTPDAVYISMETERWVYFPEGNGPGEQFVFRYAKAHDQPRGWYLDWKPHYANLLSWGRDRWLNGKIVFFQVQD